MRAPSPSEAPTLGAHGRPGDRDGGPRGTSRSIDVAFTRADLEPAGVVVVIDVLRATTTITRALAAGYERVLCIADCDRAKELRTADRLLAGERDNRAPPGFDMGNSPDEVEPPRAKELILSTTNGSPTILDAVGAAEEAVLLASMANFSAVIAAMSAGDVLLACSGSGGRLALEDTYLAGRISASLEGERTDAARTAECLARAYDSPLDAIQASDHARLLEDAGFGSDIAACAREDSTDVVPTVVGVEDDVAVVEQFRESNKGRPMG